MSFWFFCVLAGGQQGLIQCFQSPVSPVPCLLLSSLNFNVNPLLLMMIIHSTLAPETEADLYSIGCYSCCICVGPLQQTDFVAGHTPVLILLYISGTILMVWTRQSPQLQHSMIFWCYDEQKLEWLFYFDAFKVC